MNRTQEIRDTLSQAEQVEAITPDAGAWWLARYRDHVACLLDVVASYGPPLAARLREQSIQIAELRRTVRRQRWALVSLAALLVFAVLVGLATVHSEAAARRAEAPGPVVEFAQGNTDGTYCGPWEPTGEPCSGGGCLWYRWCTDCIPGCDWYRETECRPNPGSSCPFFAFAGAAVDSVDGDRGKQP